MSATLDSDMFSRYFSLPINGRLEGAPVVTVEGRAFPVKEYYLNDIIRAVRKVRDTFFIMSNCSCKNVVDFLHNGPHSKYLLLYVIRLLLYVTILLHHYHLVSSPLLPILLHSKVTSTILDVIHHHYSVSPSWSFSFHSTFKHIFHQSIVSQNTPNRPCLFHLDSFSQLADLSNSK